MPTTRKPAEDAPPDISPEQRTAFDAYVTELSQLSTPPKAPETPTGPKPVTDAQWDGMSDRARESWVRQLVDSRLDDLSRDDEIARHAAEIAALKEKPEPEGTPAGPMPTVLSRLQKFLWGEPNP